MKAAAAFFLLLGSWSASLAEGKCFLPDGSAATNPQWAQCSTDASDPLSYICCALNRTNPAGGKKSDGLTADTCLPNGLCQNEVVDDSGNHSFSYTRAYCTTADWGSGHCLTLCGKTGTGFKTMTPCDGTSSSDRWCCGTSTDCCNPDSKLDVVTLAKKFSGQSTTTSSSSSSSASPTASGTSASVTTNTSPAASPTNAGSTGSQSTPTTSPSTPSDTAAASTNTGLTTGAKAGIGIGATLGACALIGVGAWMALASTRRKAAKKSQPYAAELGSDVHPVMISTETKHPYMIGEGDIHEAASQREASELSNQPYTMSPGELPGQTMVSELPGDSAKGEKGRHW